jgi:hypothetical protein
MTPWFLQSVHAITSVSSLFASLPSHDTWKRLGLFRKSVELANTSKALSGASHVEQNLAFLVTPRSRVLIVGAERPVEFSFASEQGAKGRDVTVANPRVTVAARQFWAGGGNFVPSRVEDLPRDLPRFDEIRENYPYPSGPHAELPRPFVLARLRRLAKGARWIVYTESLALARTLRAAIESDRALRQLFRVSLARIPFDEAPQSNYPQIDSRYRVIFQRLR